MSVAKTSICQVPWTFTLLPVNPETSHPFIYFLAVLRELNYVVLDTLLFSPPYLLFFLPSFLFPFTLVPFLLPSIPLFSNQLSVVTASVFPLEKTISSLQTTNIKINRPQKGENANLHLHCDTNLPEQI